MPSTVQHGPVVGERPRAPVAHVHHRLDGDDHARAEQRAATGLAVVRDLGVLVHVPADPVADVLAHDGEPFAFDDLLHGGADVGQPRAERDLRDPGLEGLLRDPTSFSASADGGSPTNIVSAESEWNPSQIAPKSKERMSPSDRTRVGEGMPCTTSSLIEAQIDAGKPW